MIRVLLVTGVVTTEHNYRKMNEVIRTLLESTGCFKVDITEAFDGCGEAVLKNYDVIFLNYDGKTSPADPLYKRWRPVTEEAFFKFVEGGGGLVIYHSSAWLSDEMPDIYKKLWGFYFTNKTGGRRNPSDEPVMEVSGAGHPITAGLPKRWTCVGDDLFAGGVIDSGASVEILATAFDALKDYQGADFPPPHHPVVIPEGRLELMRGVNEQQPVAWINYFGKGRIFGVTTGHGEETFHRPGYMTLLARGVQWAAGGGVTIDMPDRSGENRLNPWPYYQQKRGER